MSGNYLVLLNQKEIRIIAQMLHMRMMDDKPGDSAEALVSLKDQAPSVYLDPRKHRVYKDVIPAPANAVKFNGKFYVPE